MAKKKTQRRFRVGSEYTVEGVSEKVRRLRYAGPLKLGKKRTEYLVFRPVYKVKKTKATS